MEIQMILGILLLIAGLVLVGIEMTIPGFGVPGVSGIVCLFFGIFLTAETFEQGLTLTVILLVIIAIMLTVIMTLLNSRKLKPPIVLSEDVGGTNGFLSARDLEYLVGKEGTASTDLKPAGKCDIDGIEFDVRSEGKYVKKGTKVRISKIKDSMLIVKEL